MKRSLIIAFVIFTTLATTAYAQKREYAYSCGKKTGSVTTVVKPASDGTLDLHIDINGVISEVRCDRNFRCTICHMTDKKNGKEISYVLENGVYHITGKIGKKEIDTKVASKGKPWFQNLSVSAGFICSKGKSVQFETFRPFETNLAVMEAKITGEQKVGERDALNVRVTPTGAGAKLWHGDYFVDSEDSSLLKYSSVEGIPSVTPLTTWTIKY